MTTDVSQSSRPGRPSLFAKTPATRRAQRGLVAGLGIVAVLVASAAAFIASATPLGDVARLLAYVVLGVVVPGTLAHKALRGTLGSWVADLSLGAALGLALELMAWAIASLLDIRELLWLWPALSLGLLASRTTRSRILSRPDRSWHPLSSGVVAAACVLVVVQLDRTFMQAYELPPSGHPYFPDLLWHMGLASEATRSLPLGTPQAFVAGPLRYHWFSNAHIAAESMISGTDVPTLVLRLWFVPVAICAVTLTAVLAERISGRSWAGALAAWLVVSTLSFPFWRGIVSATNHLNPLSPSQLFSLPLTLLLMVALVDLVRGSGKVSQASPDDAHRWRGERAPGAVGVAVLAAVACTGAKASALPVVLGGVVTTLVVSLFLRRRRALLLTCTVVLSVLVGLALTYVAGGDSGQGIQVFSALSLLAPYRALITRSPDLTTPVLTGLVHAPGVGPVLGIALIVAAALIFFRLCSFVLPFALPRLRSDLAAWLLAGACASAFVPFLLLAHAGYSQFYFVQGAIPFGSALWAWGVADLVGRSRSRARMAAAGAVCVGAASAVAGGLALTSPAAGTRAAVLSSLRTFVVQVAIAAVVLLLVAVLVWWRRRRGDDRWVALPVAMLIAPLLVAGPLFLASTPSAAKALAAKPHSALLMDQGLAAGWIADHVPLNALMATNDHCSTGSGLTCYSRQWWISGLAGRRVLIESWGYVPRAATSGWYDPSLYALNQSVFTQPSAANVARLRARGVGWLVAEQGPGVVVSPRLDTVAVKKYENGHIAVFQIR
ncbi:MAG: hypothetical protein ABI112_18690 [Terracoccus sp.]